MKRNHLSAMTKMCVVALSAAAFLFASCAQDGFKDERFQTSVRNTQLTSPAVENITITPTSDKSRTIISWKVVEGASSYDCKVYDVTDETPVVLVDSIIDNVSFIVKREEDHNYQFSIKTLANTSLGNTDAAEPTLVDFNSFMTATATIESGTDLRAYFKENLPSEDEATEDVLVYDLAAGGTYEVTDSVDFGANYVVLRCTDKKNRPTIKLGAGTDDEGNPTVGQINTSAPLTLQNIIVDCTDVPDDTKNSAVIALSKYPVEKYKAKTGGGNYYNIMDEPVALKNCDFKNVKGMLVYDGNKAYCIETLLIQDCNVHFAVPTQQANLAYIYMPGGFIKDLTIKNTTMWNTGAGNLQYGVRYNNSGRLDRAGYDRGSQTQSVNHINSTFYNLAYGWWANYNGFAGQTYTNFDIENNIFYECGIGGSGIARRLLGGRQASSYGSCVFANNTYWTKGAPETEGAPGQESPTYDLSGTALQTDPAFVDAVNGNFTPTGAEQVEKKTGDPRWFN